MSNKPSFEWYTPQWLVEDARFVLGSIDFDPYSCVEANKTVKAPHYYTLEQQGRWPTGVRIFCNPPSGMVGKAWLDCAVAYHKHGSSVFWVGFSLNQLCTLQDFTYSPLDYPTCILRKRVKFDGQDGKESPRYHNYVTLLSANEDVRERFAVRLAEKGKLINV